MRSSILRVVVGIGAASILIGGTLSAQDQRGAPGVQAQAPSGVQKQFSSDTRPFVAPPGPPVGRATPLPYQPYFYPGYNGFGPGFGMGGYGAMGYGGMGYGGMGYGYGSDYGPVPMTQKYRYPYPQYEFPKLGLQYIYPYSYQFGIQVPPDSDPYFFGYEPAAGQNLSAQAAAPDLRDARQLMQKGRYADAGRLLARDLGDQAAAPEVYLMISEALWAAGKPADADLVLRQAVETAPSLRFLDTANVPGDFPSRDVVNAKLNDIPQKYPLLRGTMDILAGERDKGIEVLRDAAASDAAAKKVYMHFVGAAFGSEAPAEGQKAPPSPAPPAGAKS